MSKKNSSQLSEIEYNLEEAFKKPIGINDPEGINLNPLTGKPYQNLYKNDSGTTYAELAKNVWTNLIVYQNKDKILKSIKKNQVTLVKAGTGVGKTVLIPKIALHAVDYKQKVICTIPKQIITRKTSLKL